MNTNQINVSRNRGKSRITTRVFGRITQEVAMNANILRMASAIVMAVALIVLSSPVLAQDTAPVADPAPAGDTTATPAPAINMADASVLWTKDENPARLARNLRLFAQAVVFYRDNAPSAVKGIIGRDGGKKKAKLETALNKLPQTGLSAVEPLAPMLYAGMKRDWEDFARTAQSCDPGAPESAECKVFFETSERLARGLIALVNDKELTAEAEGFLGTISNDFRADATLGTKDDYLMLALLAQAAIFSLPSNYWLPLVLKASSIPGTEMTYSDLLSKHGGYVTLPCIQKGMVSGVLSGQTNEDVLILEKDGVRYQAQAADLVNCRIFYLESNAPAPSAWELAQAAKASGSQIEHWDVLTACPSSMEELIGRKVAVYREGAETVEDTVTSVTDADFTIGEGEMAVTITCASIADGSVIVALGPQTIIEDGAGTIGMMDVGAFGGYGYGAGSNADSTHFAIVAGEFVFRPLSKLNFSLNLNLKLGALFASGVYPYASEVPSDGDRWTFFGAVGIGGSYLYKIFEVGIVGSFAFTGEGGMGALAELRVGLRFKYVMFYLGFLSGWLDSGISGGNNPDVIPSVKEDSIKSGIVGAEAGIVIPLWF